MNREQDGSNAVIRSARSNRKYIGVLLGSLLVGLTLGLGPAAASAGTVSGSVGLYTVDGYRYRNYAVIATTTSPHYATAYTFTGPNSGSVPAGYPGSRGRLFEQDGAMYCEGSNTYSSATITYPNTQGGISCQAHTAGAWYSYGVSLAFNGSGYTSFYTFLSPDQNS